jgi:Uncharacterized protein conserved in bacteria (DUF2255)
MTWIWSVAVDGALYVRGYNGQNSRWYQAAVRQKAGRIITAGMTKEVTLRAGRRADHRRRLPGEVPRQPVPQPDDQRPRPLRHGQGHAARHRCLIVEHGRCAMPEKAPSRRAVKQRIKNMRIGILGSGSRTEDAAGRNRLTGSSGLGKCRLVIRENGSPASRSSSAGSTGSRSSSSASSLPSSGSVTRRLGSCSASPW